MKQLVVIILTAMVLQACQIEKSKKTTFTYPPEWESQEAVWVAWSDDPSHPDANAFLLEVVGELTSHIKVNMVVVNDSIKRHVTTRMKTMNIPMDSVSFYNHFDTILWMRDPGPFFVKDGDGNLGIADFKWKAYNWFKVYRGINYVDSLPQIVANVDGYGDYFAKQLRLNVEKQSTTYAEGGALEVNGNGSMMAVEEMALDRNEGKTLQEIEKDFLATFGKTNMLWLKRSIFTDLSIKGPQVENYFGGGANGHIDEFCRFVNDSTVLLGEISEEEALSNPLSRLDREALEENYNYILGQKQPNGKPWNIKRIPMPNLDILSREVVLTEETEWAETFFEKGFKICDTLKNYPASSYLNFLITNGAVLGAKYWKPGLPEAIKVSDDQAAKVLQELFPNRKIIQLDAITLNWHGGGIHCVTQQEPKLSKK
ncbi:MAG: agmatine deiminase family protein [Saprospiraceae bacterium]|nr:agmatine deiminase family protein [Saprospiraceae bacterium]